MTEDAGSVQQPNECGWSHFKGNETNCILEPPKGRQAALLMLKF
jgi:hypothetical protein